MSCTSSIDFDAQHELNWIAGRSGIIIGDPGTSRAHSKLPQSESIRNRPASEAGGHGDTIETAGLDTGKDGTASIGLAAHVPSKAETLSGDKQQSSQTPDGKSSEKKARRQVIVEKSLWEDLDHELYRRRFDPKTLGSSLYEALQKEAKRFLICIIISLHQHGDVFTGRPISHVFADMIRSIVFFRSILKTPKQIDEETELEMFLKRRQTFWKTILTSCTLASNLCIDE